MDWSHFVITLGDSPNEDATQSQVSRGIYRQDRHGRGSKGKPPRWSGLAVSTLHFMERVLLANQHKIDPCAESLSSYVTTGKPPKRQGLPGVDRRIQESRQNYLVSVAQDLQTGVPWMVLLC